MAAIFLFALCITSSAFAADQWQAREVARNNNCPPKKIEVYQQSIGMDGKTIFRVDCNLPKGKGDTGTPSSSALLIGCNESICELVRPLPPEAK
ncbi:MAG: hypothetical protein WAO98_09245 [Alphaproteobacteria bacterium]